MTKYSELEEQLLSKINLSDTSVSLVIGLRFQEIGDKLFKFDIIRRIPPKYFVYELDKSCHPSTAIKKTFDGKNSTREVLDYLMSMLL